jgi:glutamate/aspartate transport system substrate-binding protein
VNDAIGQVYKSGEINKIYHKWFESPIPPKGINLKVPMSAELKKVIANPTDSGDPKAYE